MALGLNWDWNKLNVNLRSTRYGKYTVIEVECLGACGFNTPVMINEEFLESVTPETVPGILSKLA